MAANIVLPWTHRAFALMKRRALGSHHGLRRKHITTYLDEFVFVTTAVFTGTFRSKSSSVSPPMARP
jgi:ISXO2-like transposase domain